MFVLRDRCQESAEVYSNMHYGGREGGGGGVRGASICLRMRRGLWDRHQGGQDASGIVGCTPGRVGRTSRVWKGQPGSDRLRPPD